MLRIYLDTNIVIYLVEDSPNAPQVQAYLLSQVNATLYSSNLTLMECLVKPLQQGDLAMQRRFVTFFQSLAIVPARRQVFRRAAQIRAATRLRTPDSLHIAFASCARCDIFLTGDSQIAQQWQQWVGRYSYPSRIVVL